MKKKILYMLIALTGILSITHKVDASEAKCVYGESDDHYQYIITIVNDKLSVEMIDNVKDNFYLYEQKVAIGDIRIGNFINNEKYECRDYIISSSQLNTQTNVNTHMLYLNRETGTTVFLNEDASYVINDEVITNPEVPEDEKNNEDDKDNTNDSNVGNTNDNFFGNLEVVKCGNLDIPAPIPPITRLIVTFIKIATPLVLIIMGMIDIVKAVTADDEKKIKEAQTKFIKRLIPAALVFLFITILQLLIGILADNSSESETIIKCIDCMVSDSSKCGQITGGTSSNNGTQNGGSSNGGSSNGGSSNGGSSNGGSSNGGSSNGGSSNGGSSNGNKFVTSSKEITFEYNYFKNGSIPYALYTPSTAKTNDSTPLIIWLHGTGEAGEPQWFFESSGLLSLLNKWSLEGFNAYVLCPHLPSTYDGTYWNNNQVKNNLYKLIDDIIRDKKINRDKIILTGHSIGGQGVLYTAYNKTNYYSALVVLSGYNPGVDISQLTKIPTKGFVENNGNSNDYMNGDFANAFGKKNVTVYTASHAEIPKLAFTTDKNNDQKSDLIEWILTQ